MNRRRGLIVLASLAALAAACSENPTQPGAGASRPEEPTEKVATVHFRILADRADITTCRAIGDGLEAAYPRMKADLGNPELPIISAWLWTDQAAFYDAMRRNIGATQQGATGYVFGGRNLALLVVPAVESNATHELAHLVSIGVNPRIGNNPRWLWEAVALYENREFVDPWTVAYMRDGRYPTLATLNSTYDLSRQVYDVGYLIGEFIVSEWGLDGMVRLIRANGDLQTTVGLTDAQFEARWYAFLRSKYGLP